MGFRCFNLLCFGEEGSIWLNLIELGFITALFFQGFASKTG